MLIFWGRKCSVKILPTVIALWKSEHVKGLLIKVLVVDTRRLMEKAKEIVKQSLWKLGFNLYYWLNLQIFVSYNLYWWAVLHAIIAIMISLHFQRAIQRFTYNLETVHIYHFYYIKFYPNNSFKELMMNTQWRSCNPKQNPVWLKNVHYNYKKPYLVESFSKNHRFKWEVKLSEIW